MSILAVQNLMQWEKLLEKARRVWFNRKWKQVVVLKGARRDGGGTGSIPVAGIYYAQIAQLVEQRTENPRVTGSIPVLGIFLYD